MPIEWMTVLSRLNKVPGFSATAEHVALFKDLYEQTQRECERLQDECQRLRAENEELKKQIATTVLPSDLVEVEGLLWKRKPTGGFESKPRCPNCPKHPVLYEFPPRSSLHHWNCSVCNGVFDFAEPPK